MLDQRSYVMSFSVASAQLDPTKAVGGLSFGALGYGRSTWYASSVYVNMILGRGPRSRSHVNNSPPVSGVLRHLARLRPPNEVPSMVVDDLTNVVALWIRLLRGLPQITVRRSVGSSITSP